MDVEGGGIVGEGRAVVIMKSVSAPLAPTLVLAWYHTPRPPRRPPLSPPKPMMGP